MCEGLSKISSNFTLHLIKVGKLKRFKKVLSDLKTILMAAFADLRLLAVSRALRKVKHVNQPLIMLRRKIALRDGPLEKLCGGGGGFSGRRNCFSLSNSCMNFF